VFLRQYIPKIGHSRNFVSRMNEPLEKVYTTKNIGWDSRRSATRKPSSCSSCGGSFLLKVVYVARNNPSIPYLSSSTTCIVLSHNNISLLCMVTYYSIIILSAMEAGLSGSQHGQPACRIPGACSRLNNDAIV
jgi:hypothetical protein